MSDCVICDLPSNGHHFGVPCCRACAAFFRRTFALGLAYKCRLDGNCDVTKRLRYSCRYCRYQKCIATGMRKEKDDGENDDCDSPPSSFNRPQRRSAGDTDESDVPSLSSPNLNNGVGQNGIHAQNNHYFVEPSGSAQQPLALSDFQLQIKSRIEGYFLQNRTMRSAAYPANIPLTLCQQALIAYTEHNAHWPECTFEKMQHRELTTNVDQDVFMRNLYTEIEYVALICMQIEPFAELAPDQKWIFFKHFWPRFCKLDRSFVSSRLLGNDPNDDRYVSYDGSIIKLTQTFEKYRAINEISEEEVNRLMLKSQEALKKIFIIPFKKLRTNEFEMVYMALSAMFNVKKETVAGLSEASMQVAELVKTRLAEDLHNYYSFELRLPNYADRIHKMSNVVASLDRLQELCREDMHMSRIFNIFQEDIFLHEVFGS